MSYEFNIPYEFKFNVADLVDVLNSYILDEPVMTIEELLEIVVELEEEP